jgi:cell division protein ZapB
LTLIDLRSIFVTMSNQEKDAIDLDLQKLEARVEELIRTCAGLEEENQALKVSQESLVAERAELIEKTELAKTRVESMISRLKSMESGS